MLLVLATRAKVTPNLPSLSRMRYFGLTPKAVASRSCCAVQASVGDRVTPTWITLRECSSIMKKANNERKKRSVTGRRVAGPDLLSMRAEEGLPGLPTWPGGAHGSHVLLNGALADAYPQLEQFALDALCSPESVVPGHLLNQGHRLCGEFRLRRCCSGLVFPVELEALAMPARASSVAER
jgi:hypothetical protein